jgi:hypothetical protein
MAPFLVGYAIGFVLTLVYLEAYRRIHMSMDFNSLKRKHAESQEPISIREVNNIYYTNTPFCGYLTWDSGQGTEFGTFWFDMPPILLVLLWPVGWIALIGKGIYNLLCRAGRYVINKREESDEKKVANIVAKLNSQIRPTDVNDASISKARLQGEDTGRGLSRVDS